MAVFLIFAGLPVITYLSLALLPRGRSAAVGIAAAGVLVLVLWWSAVPQGGGDGFALLLVWLAGGAIGLAALAQGLRAVLGEGRPAWLYPMIVTLALLGAGLPVLTLLGV